MKLILAPDYHTAVLVASQKNLHRGHWRNVQTVHDLRGHDPTTVHILIHTLWAERPHITYVPADLCICGQPLRRLRGDEYVHDSDDSAMHPETVVTVRRDFPITETLNLYRMLGAKIEHVTT